MLLNKNIGGTVHVDLKEQVVEIYYIISATNQQGTVNAYNGDIRLIKGRIYYIPIDNKKIDSDEFNTLKIFSDMADKIDIKFVKEGFCCAIPIIHNIHLKHGQKLCSLY